MTLDQIIKAEHAHSRATNALTSFDVSNAAAHALNDGCAILAEVRHFRVCWADIDAMGEGSETTRQLREEAITRLVRSITG